MLCCFYSTSKKKKNKNRSIPSKTETNYDAIWEKNEEMLTDLSTFSVEEQERRLSRAKKEEDRRSREAERVVQWVRRESARFDVSTIDHLSSQDKKVK